MPNTLKKILRIAITPGEPAGIGPDLVIKLSQSSHKNELVIIADPTLLHERANLLGIPLIINAVSINDTAKPSGKGVLHVLPVLQKQPTIVGKLNQANAPYVLDTLNTAIDGCLQKKISAFVTGPVHKGIINDAGISFSGHTEYLATRTNTPQVVMMLATHDLRVALATTHLPLKDVASAITQKSLTRTLEILHHDLQHKFAISAPHILIAGLNPHAGEGGHLGLEEIEVIEPVIKFLQKKGMKLTGPLPADTLFTPKHLNTCDAVLAMYHDQGLPVLKYKGFGRAVNITLGLPIIRTSVDHGTALDLAGTGNASEDSMLTALSCAIKMAEANYP